jgi:hypothetical protein
MVTEKENLTVTIDRETNIYINDFQVRMDFLKESWKRFLREKRTGRSFFRADKDVAIWRRCQCDGGNQGRRCGPAGHGDRPLRRHRPSVIVPVKKADEKKHPRSGAFIQDLRGNGQMPLFYPMAISLVCHVVFLVAFVVTPSLRSERPPARSVINVSMVSIKNHHKGYPTGFRGKQGPLHQKA